MNARERHGVGAPPSWSRPSQAFRHFDGSAPNDWRHAHPGLPAKRRRAARFPWRRWARHVGAWALNQIHPDPRERQRIYIYLIFSAWVVMCTIGILAAHGIHP
jgi:hypothetical protein